MLQTVTPAAERDAMPERRAARGGRATHGGASSAVRTAAAVTRALQAYADRGVFRGFHAEPVRGGGVSCRFSWLMRRPMHVAFDARRGVLAFSNLFPSIGTHPDIAAALAAAVRERHTRAVPEHKRIDARRARVSTAQRGGSMTLTVSVRGTNHEYAVRGALNLVNELFLLLQESYPDYLVEHFGLSTE
jgi:hypothetical protein